MKKLVVVAVHPIHYNDFLFHELDKSGINIDVYYVNKSLSHYPWKNRLNYSFPQQDCKYFLGVDWRLVKKIILERNNVYLVYGWDSFSKNILLLFLRFFFRKYMLFTDTYQGHVNRSVLKGSLRALWLKFIFSGAHRILTTGQVGTDRLRAFYDNEKVISFPFATDIDYFATKPDFSGFHEEKIIFSSGRLSNSHKGYDVAIKALALVKQRGYKFKYLIAGTGPDETAITTLIKESGLEKNVHLLGWVELDKLTALYKGAHIFLHASHFDPFPNCILEAMASGLIVVSSDAAGSSIDRINDGVNGFLFHDDSVNDLADTISAAFELGKEKLEEMSVKARQTSEKWHVQYNVDVIHDVMSAH
jgi:glycosyltransferase involved in cell wall biosynthesis